MIEHINMLNIIKLTTLLGLLINFSSASASEQTSLMTLEKEGFIFELQNCKNKTNAEVPLECEFKVENIKKNRRVLNLCINRSRIVDSAGNEIRGLSGNLGNRDETTSPYNPYNLNLNLNYGYDSYSCNNIQQGIELVNGVPMKGIITFKKAPEGQILLLDLGCYSQDTNVFNVEFIL